MNKEQSLIWKHYFNKHAFGNCQICSNIIRVTPEISRFLKLNYFKNVKMPQVQFVENVPICFCCSYLGETINEISYNYNLNPVKLDKHIYIGKWYELNKLCIHYNTSKNQYCGNKNIYDNGMCQEHNNLFENDGRVCKKSKTF